MNPPEAGPNLRLVADDLTGALDSAAHFVEPGGAIPVYLEGRLPESLPLAFAIDAGTRERDGAAAAAIASRLGPVIAPRPGSIAFKKMDSLLRGHCGAELAATLRAAPDARFVIAPAFPFHGRVTRGGLQFELRQGAWHRVGEDLRAALESSGVAVRAARAGEPVPEGVSLWDAESDGDLLRIAGAGMGLDAPVLWCGSGGLAAALVRGQAPLAGAPRRPILGFFGSDHAATAAQLRACGEHVLRPEAGGADAPLISACLEASGVCLVAFSLPPGTARNAAHGRIALEVSRLARRLEPPRSLLVAGGETLRALCLSLGVDRLDVVGQRMPGVPVSVMRGGRWDGVRVVSKSGAFGDELLLRRLLGPDEARQGWGGAD